MIRDNCLLHLVGINSWTWTIFFINLNTIAKTTQSTRIMYKLVIFSIIVGLVASQDAERDAQIRSFDNDISPDGAFHYSYETSNGIAVSAQGDALSQTGSAQWNTPDGVPVSFQYTADENGYRATGDFVPKTPEYILRALEWIKAHPPIEEPAEPQQQQQQQQQAIPQRRF